MWTNHKELDFPPKHLLWMMSLRETLKNIRSVPDPPNEETAKLQILVPILQDLGWNLSRQEVIFEHQVGAKGGGRIDIALRGPERIVAFIEAKAPRIDLSRYEEQVVKYAFHEGVDICVLTNGLEWWLYLPMKRGPFEQRRFETLRIRTDPEDLLGEDLLAFMSKENLVTGAALDLGERRYELRKAIPKAWGEIVTRPSDALLDLVSQRVYEEVGIWPANEEVVRLLNDSDPVIPRKPSPEDSPSSPPRPVEAGPKLTRFRLFKTQYRYKSWRDMSLQVAEVLYNRHSTEFDRVLSLRGRKHPYASRDPADLRNSQEVGGSGYYLDATHFGDNRRDCVYELLEIFDYSRSNLEMLYD